MKHLVILNGKVMASYKNKKNAWNYAKKIGFYLNRAKDDLEIYETSTGITYNVSLMCMPLKSC